MRLIPRKEESLFNMESFLGITFLLISKIIVLIGLFVYLVFAFVIVRQVNLMNTTVETEVRKPIEYFSYIHLILSLAVLILAFVIL